MILTHDIQPENIIAIGDIHGAFNEIVFKINSQYALKDSIFILCGDIGMGFYNSGYYKETFKKLNKKLKDKNNFLYALRGNHDNPKYFSDYSEFALNYSNFKLLEDYSIIETPTACILTTGGAYSIDRYDRRNARIVDMCYWPNEHFNFDIKKLDNINFLYKGQITHVCTHSAPVFCKPNTKEGIAHIFIKDPELYFDLNKEREDHSLLLNYLIENKQPIKQWCYGHFHFSNTEYIEGIKYCLLDCNQLLNLL